MLGAKTPKKFCALPQTDKSALHDLLPVHSQCAVNIHHLVYINGSGFPSAGSQAQFIMASQYMLASISRNTEERQKHASKKKGAKIFRKIDLESETIKRLMDGIFDPWELGVEGGTGAFEENVVYKSIKGELKHLGSPCIGVKPVNYLLYLFFS